MKQRSTRIKYLAPWALFTPVFLFGCGGGGGSSAEQDLPIPELAITPISAAIFDEVDQISLIAEVENVGTNPIYSWTQLSGPEVELSNSEKAHLQFEAPKVSADSELLFQLHISNNEGQEDSISVPVTILDSHEQVIVSGTSMAGDTPLLNANVVLTIGTLVVSSTTDSEGVFSIPTDIDKRSMERVYTLTTKGSGEQSDIELANIGAVSELLPVQEIQPTAFSFSTSTQYQRAKTIHQDYLSTSLSSLLMRYYSNNFSYTTWTWLDFQNRLKRIDTELLWDLAAAFTIDGSRTSVHESHLDDIIRWISAYKTDNASVENFIEKKRKIRENARKEIENVLDDNTYYYLSLGSAPGTVRLGISLGTERIRLRNGLFESYGFDTVTTAPYQFDDGRILIDTTNWPVHVEENVYFAEHNSHFTCTTTLTEKSIEPLKLIEYGVQHILFRDSTSQICINADGLSLDEKIEQRETPVIAYKRNNMEKWADAEVAGREFAFRFYGPGVDGNPLLESDAPVVTYQFLEGTSGYIPEYDEHFNWIIDTHGELVLMFENDFTIIWRRLYDARDVGVDAGPMAIAAEYRASEGHKYFQGMAVIKDENTPWHQAIFPGKWNHGFNLSEPSDQASDALFFFEFEQGGLGSANNYDRPSATHNWSAPMLWYFEESLFQASRNYIWQDGSFVEWSQCDHRTDVDCYSFQFRTWEVLAKVGERYYVKETLYHDGDAFRRGAPAAQVSDIPYSVRINFYEPETRAY
ncbi:hypothetical protein EZV61_14670 [Corallincola luteus]|uniref:Uncharacterized protein n=1 Tax=Corallincola luteus TaxID=1775177 RepID=A0ABY2AIR3_9GAMM|nr:hypothetical protein [Corallincola luteus]TCI02178.1 hypothetical protein EZV61_14670 [Corallincola luteus]